MDTKDFKSNDKVVLQGMDPNELKKNLEKLSIADISDIEQGREADFSPSLDSSIGFQESEEAKKTLRQQYYLDVEKIKYEIGDLEEIRRKLGVSQRKLCQMLLVDPSAWTRWIKSGAPPHVYQSLKWLLKIRDQNPGYLNPPYIEEKVERVNQSLSSKIKNLESEILALQRDIEVTSHSNLTFNHDSLERVVSSQTKRFDFEVQQLKTKIDTLYRMQVSRLGVLGDFLTQKYILILLIFLAGFLLGFLF